MTFIYNGSIETKFKFKRNCLIQGNTTFAHGNALYLFIIYELDIWPRDLNTDFTLGYCIFQTVKLNKTVDSYKYGYSGYGTGFDAHS